MAGWSGGIVMLAASGSATAGDLISCRMPNGDVRIVAVPPEGCVVTEPFKLRKAPRSSPGRKEAPPIAEAAPPSLPWPPRGEPAPAPTPDQPALSGAALTAFLEDAARDRETIERRAEDVGERLERHREQVAALPKIEPETFQSSEHGSSSYVDTVRKRAEVLEKLREEELGILKELDGVKNEFSVLSARVTAANGGEVPEKWDPQMQCEACPRS